MAGCQSTHFGQPNFRTTLRSRRRRPLLALQFLRLLDPAHGFDPYNVSGVCPFPFPLWKHRRARHGGLPMPNKIAIHWDDPELLFLTQKKHFSKKTCREVGGTVVLFLSEDQRYNAGYSRPRTAAHAVAQHYQEGVCRKGVFVEHSHSAGGVVINPAGRVLCVSQRGTSWSLPKGHIHAHEDLVQAAIREIAEESGLTHLVFIRFLGTYQRYRIGPQGDDPSELKTLHMFLFRTDETELHPTDPDNPEARWVEVDKVVELLTHQKDRDFFLGIIDGLC